VQKDLLSERTIAKMTKRRGRRHAFPSLDPCKTALVVIDMVDAFATEDESIRSITGPISTVATALRKAGGAVAWVIPAPVEDCPDTALKTAILGEHTVERLKAAFAADSPGIHLISGLQAMDQDIEVTKTAYSAFFPGTCDLPDVLRERGIDTVLIAGVLTNVCCESSARDAMMGGFRVVVIADANAARNEEEHAAALNNIYRNFGDVRSSTELAELLSSSRR
jgi:nicotinamidase-related amidase